MMKLFSQTLFETQDSVRASGEPVVRSCPSDGSGPDRTTPEFGWHRLAGDHPVMLDFRGHRASYRHAPRQAACAGSTDFAAILCVSGKVEVCVGGAAVGLSPGEISLHDLLDPGEIGFDDAWVVAARIERRVIEAAYGSTEPLDRAILRPVSAQPMSALLWRNLHAARPAHSYRGELAVILNFGLERRDGGPRSLPRAMRLQAVRAAIDQCLADRSLDAEAVVRATHLSRSTLYRLLEPFGGIGRFVIGRRLDALWHLLASPQTAGSLSELAERVGFASASHLSRAFLQQYGLRPGEFRKAFLHSDPAPFATMCLRLWEADFRALLPGR